MSSFLNAMTTNDTRTENNMPTHSTSNTALLDWFFKMGAMRKSSEAEIISLFSKAFAESPLLALKSIFYLRDIRNGLGERRTFRVVFGWLAKKYAATARVNLSNIPTFGRYDDLMAIEGSELSYSAGKVWVDGILEGNGLAAKWAPRKGSWAGLLRRVGGWPTLGSYRRYVASHSTTVEQQMCANEWEKIDYEKLPSQAGLMYRKAFSRHDAERYCAFIEAAKKDEAKVNAGTIMPHQIVGKALNGESGGVLDPMWEAIPDVFDGQTRSILPVCDVSGSMMGEPLNVSIGLGIYLSERNHGPFRDVICTFSDHPQFHKIQGNNISEKVTNLNRADWEMNTDLEAVFKLMLAKAVESKLNADEMPETILILSDMQFDQCCEDPSQNAMGMMRAAYEKAGYQMPSVVFWNLRASTGIPAKATESGVALVSGFSPNVMKGLLNGISNPTQIMLDVLNNSRYDVVRV